MALYLQARQIAIWEFSPKFSARENIQIALTKMANFRQASTDETSLKSYAIALEDLKNLVAKLRDLTVISQRSHTAVDCRSVGNGRNEKTALSRPLI